MPMDRLRAGHLTCRGKPIFGSESGRIKSFREHSLVGSTYFFYCILARKTSE
jgi:hypothetical protein